MKRTIEHTLPEFKEDKRKILEALVYLIDSFRGFSQYDLVKTIFLADRSHLNRYGRPITFDNYYAMEHGPVPSFTYRILDPSFDFQRHFHEERPFVSLPDADNPKVNKFVGTRRQPDLQYLSETDTQLLKDAAQTIHMLDFGQIKRLTHEDPAYQEAWQRRGNAERAQINLELLLPENERGRIKDLLYISQHAT